jgi:DNA-binding MarR family transcriptional regulator
LSGVPLLDATRTLSRLASTVGALLQESGVTLNQYRVLVHIMDAPLRAGDLADLFGTSRPTLTAIIRGLERRGLVERRPVPDDGRGVSVHLTVLGREAVAAGDALLQQFVSALTVGVGLAPFESMMSELSGPLEGQAAKVRERLSGREDRREAT